MSAVPLTLVNTKLNPTTALAKVINKMNQLEQSTQDVIAMLPAMTLEEVIETRTTAQLLYMAAWKIEIACDAEIWERHEKHVGGRGKKDIDESGIMAAVNKRAKEIGVGASTIRANARLYDRFKTVLSTEQSLDDKGFYQAAMKMPDPEAAIEMFAEKRSENSHFCPADAWRIVNKTLQTPEPEHVSDLKILGEPEIIEWLTQLRQLLANHEEGIPTTAVFLRGMVHAMMGVVDGQLGRTIESDCVTVREAVKELLGTEDEVYYYLIKHFYFMSDPQFEDVVSLLTEQKRIRRKPAEGRKAGQKGKMVDVLLPLENDIDNDENFDVDAL